MRSSKSLQILSSIFISSCFLSACTSGKSTQYGACPLTEPAASKCREQKLIAACSATADRYPYVRDRLLYEEYGDLMTEDAVFQIEGQPEVRGRTAIVDALRERGPKVNMRHLSRVVHMQAIGEDSAQGISYVNIWREFKTDTGGQNESSAGPWLLGEYHDRFRMEQDKCRISHRFVKIVFQNNHK